MIMRFVIELTHWELAHCFAQQKHLPIEITARCTNTKMQTYAHAVQKTQVFVHALRNQLVGLFAVNDWSHTKIESCARGAT